jgi:hypothetical protein
METNKIFCLIVAISSYIGSPMAAGMPFHVPDAHTVHIESINIFKSGRQPVLLAKNEQESTNKESKPQTDNRDQPIDSEGVVKEKNGNSEIETSKKSLMPFKPSEEIAAEQAVDFPWDI